MTDVLCDASVAVGWFLDRHPPSYALVEASMSGRCRLVVLDLTLYEVGNVLVRRYHRSAEEASVLVRGVEAIADVHRPDWLTLRDAARIAAEGGLSFYDASYAAQALAIGAVLATEDRELLAAGLGLRAAAALELVPA